MKATIGLLQIEASISFFQASAGSARSNKKKDE